jgi:type VI secretion system protein ImpM
MTTAAGWYGKLPCIGDFASRRLPTNWQAGCDRWLSACMEQARVSLGEAWLQAYLASPVWRFAWGPQVVDESWWFGVLMPSCDSVGRYFPLVVAQARPKPPSDRFALDHLEWWWNQAALAAVATLKTDASVERFEAALEDLPPWPSTPPPGLQARPASCGQQWRMPASMGLSEIAQDLAVETLTRRMVGHSFWWPWRPQQPSQPGLQAALSTGLLVPSLPQPEQFLTMLAAPIS